MILDSLRVLRAKKSVFLAVEDSFRVAREQIF